MAPQKFHLVEDYTLGRPLSRFLSEVLLTNWAAVSAQQPVEHVKNALHHTSTQQMTQSVLTWPQVVQF